MGKARILVVEDEGITGSYIQRVLEALGYEVISVEMSGEEALDRISQDMPDLVLMDIKLQGQMDGIETAEEIRSRFNIPLVYLTAHADEAMLERAKITEPFGYVIKPFESRELLSNIEMALYKHKMEEKLKSLAHYDLLTGLPNRVLFFDRFDQGIKLSKRHQKPLALLLLDLDGFKCINDKMGHDVGDLVLQEVARRLKSCIRESDTVARFGGDEFIIILTDLSKQEDAVHLAAKVILSIGRPFRFKEGLCSLGVSIGVSLYPSDGEDKETLVKKADVAMYRAKEKGKNNYQFFLDTNEEFNMNLHLLLSQAILFVLQHKGAWDHYAWLEFLITIKKEGFLLSNNIETNTGLILESLKMLYSSLTATGVDVEQALSLISEEMTSFIMRSKGTWTHHEWEAFLDKIRERDAALDVALNSETIHIIGNILEAAKSLYTVFSFLISY